MANTRLLVGILGLTLVGCAVPVDDDMKIQDLIAASLGRGQRAPMVYTVPPASHPAWSGNNQIGQRVPFAPDSNNRQAVLQMPEWGPPERWTVSLGLEQFDSAASGFDVQAEIEFGVGGATSIVKVDWVNGAAISVNANSLRVTAVWSLAPGNNPSAFISCMAARGSASNPHPPTLSQSGLVANAGANSAIQRVPAYARRVVIYPADKNYFNVWNAASYIEFLTNAAGAVAFDAIPGDVLKAQAGSGIVVPGGGHYWRFHNGDAAGTSLSAHWMIEP